MTGSRDFLPNPNNLRVESAKRLCCFHACPLLKMTPDGWKADERDIHTFNLNHWCDFQKCHRWNLCFSFHKKMPRPSKEIFTGLPSWYILNNAIDIFLPLSSMGWPYLKLWIKTKRMLLTHSMHYIFLQRKHWTVDHTFTVSYQNFSHDFKTVGHHHPCLSHS